MRARWIRLGSVALAALGGAHAACSASEDDQSATVTPSGGTGATTGGVGGGTTASTTTGAGGGEIPTEVFPADPIFDDGVPSNAPDLFGPAGSGSGEGPCVVEPEPGSLFPRNWLRPRFRWLPAAGQNLFELRLSVASQPNDLVVYTTSPTWTLSSALWGGLTSHVLDEPIDVTVRALVLEGGSATGEPAVTDAGSFRVAPVEADGSIVYWTTSGGSSLKGFHIGDETVVDVLAPPDVEMLTSATPSPGETAVTCVGCHTSTPDGSVASFVAQSPWSNAMGVIEQGSVGARPSWLGQGAEALLTSGLELGIHAYSPAHFEAGDRVMITPEGRYGDARLIWVDLEAESADEGVAYGELARTGDARGAGAPIWSRDGSTVVYVSTTAQFTGRLDADTSAGNQGADLYRVPYASRQGGAATPIAGAAEAGVSEFYPALSPDDRFVAFNRAPAAANMYDQAAAELYLVPLAGGTPTRLDANDPPACTGLSSPGITNSWPKWSPEVKTHQARRYYFLTFSSKRVGGNPQLFVSVVVEEPNGTIVTYPALYLWNQPPAENNHTPAWDAFAVPPPPN